MKQGYNQSNTLQALLELVNLSFYMLPMIQVSFVGAVFSREMFADEEFAAKDRSYS